MPLPERPEPHGKSGLVRGGQSFGKALVKGARSAETASDLTFSHLRNPKATYGRAEFTQVAAMTRQRSGSVTRWAPSP